MGFSYASPDLVLLPPAHRTLLTLPIGILPHHTVPAMVLLTQSFLNLAASFQIITSTAQDIEPCVSDRGC